MLFLALYAVSVFSYMTATIATFFFDQDTEHNKLELPSKKSIQALQIEILALRSDIKVLSQTKFMGDYINST